MCQVLGTQWGVRENFTPSSKRLQSRELNIQPPPLRMKLIKTDRRQGKKGVKEASQRTPHSFFLSEATEAQKKLFVQRSHSQNGHQAGGLVRGDRECGSKSRFPMPVLGQCTTQDTGQSTRCFQGQVESRQCS